MVNRSEWGAVNTCKYSTSTTYPRYTTSPLHFISWKKSSLAYSIYLPSRRSSVIHHPKSSSTPKGLKRLQKFLHEWWRTCHPPGNATSFRNPRVTSYRLVVEIPHDLPGFWGHPRWSMISEASTVSWLFNRVVFGHWQCVTKRLHGVKGKGYQVPWRSHWPSFSFSLPKILRFRCYLSLVRCCIHAPIDPLRGCLSSSKR